LAAQKSMTQEKGSFLPSKHLTGAKSSVREKQVDELWFVVHFHPVAVRVRVGDQMQNLEC
jgi:hypothetical protein